MSSRRASARKRQTKLSFSPVAAFSDNALTLSPNVRSRAAAVTLKDLPYHQRKKRTAAELYNSTSDNEIGLPTPKKSSSSKRSLKKTLSSDSDVDSNPSSETLSESETKPKRTRLSTKQVIKSKHANAGSLSESDEDNGTTAIPSSSSRATRTQRARRVLSSEDLDSENDIESEETEDEKASRKATNTPFLSKTSRSKMEGHSAHWEKETDDDSEHSKSTSSAKRISRRKDWQEQEDLDEDLQFLRSSPPATRRQGQVRPLNVRQKALAELKQRRTAAKSSSSTATPGRRRTVVLSDDDSVSGLEVISQEESANEEIDAEMSEDNEEGDEGEHERGFRTRALDVFQENEDDEGFIVDGDEDLIGEPVDAQLPLHFSSLNRAKPKELFKYAVEWMVQRKINPAFSSRSEIYDLTFRKLDDEVNGLANSKYSSAVWTLEFTRALRARPEIFINDIPKHLRAVTSDHCEACNRRTHPASCNITFTGKPYNRETLEPLAEDSDSDSDSDSFSSEEQGEDAGGEKPTYDAQGELIPPESRVFGLGSTCQANAQIAHTLFHWRYHLNSWVVEYLERRGHLDRDRLVERDKMSVRKRGKQARKIVRAMEKEGKIGELHKLYKDQVDFALETKNDYTSGWGRRGH